MQEPENIKELKEEQNIDNINEDSSCSSESINEDTIEQNQEEPSNENPSEFKILSNSLDDIKEKLHELNLLFDEKIKYDEYKNQMFDNMHKELTDFRNEANEKNINSMALDIIQLMDSYKKLLAKFEQVESSEENYKRLISNFYGILEDLTDVLYRQNIEEYTIEEDSVDVKKQKIISTIPTDEESLNNTIAEKLSPGYEKNNKVLRPERISIYKYIKKGE